MDSTNSKKTALQSTQVVIDGNLQPAQIVIEDGKISQINKYKTTQDFPVEDVGNLVIMPGLVDTHVHINEPGRTEWEGFNTGTQSAAAGGITCVVDMPLNCTPVTTNVDALQQKMAALFRQVFQQDPYFDLNRKKQLLVQSSKIQLNDVLYLNSLL